MRAEPSREQALALRDRFFALQHASPPPAPDDERLLALRTELEQVDAPALAQLDGLSLSFFPSARFSLLRFVELVRLPEQLRPLCARPSPEQPQLAAVFVDPEELSYRSFENIIALDPMFAHVHRAKVGFSPFEPLAEGIWRSTLELSKRTRALLARLDQLQLYAPPLNPGSRGGRRFIFSSSSLAKRLFRALRPALPAPLLEGVAHLNPVFRCSRFEPGDARFLPHVDSPYVDAARRHMSKYTLLLYLEGGAGEATLRFGEALTLDAIDAMRVLVFRQDLEHEGGPFVDGPKLVLRTELVYELPSLPQSLCVAREFARACYLGSHSLFEPELERHAAAAYDHAALARWRAQPPKASPEPFLHKHFRGVEFVANGYDYWFRRAQLSLPQCAALALLDVVNAKLGDQSFRKQCRSRMYTRPYESKTLDWIAARLTRGEEPLDEPPFARLDRRNKRALLPPLEREDPAQDQDYEVYGRMSEFEFEHAPEGWDAQRSRRLLRRLAEQRAKVEPIIERAPIIIMGQELFLDPERFVVEGDKIHILSNERLAPLNFAGGFAYYDESSFSRIAFRLGAPALLVPPISWRERGQLLHLSFDLFRNGWLVRYEARELEVEELIGPDEYPRSIA